MLWIVDLSFSRKPSLVSVACEGLTMVALCPAPEMVRPLGTVIGKVSVYSPAVTSRIS